MDTLHQIKKGAELLTDQQVIERVAAGDLPFFEILIRRYNSVLYKIARSYGFNHQDAEDLMQDTHVAAYLALKKFEGRSSYKTWISRIMVNKCLYKLQYGYFKNEVPSDVIPEPQQQPMPSRTNNPQPEQAVVNRELSAILEKSLQEIPVDYRTVFVLREVEGFSVAETAELLGISTVNVKVRLNRAKSMLQKQIEKTYSKSDLYSFNLIYCDDMVKKVFERIANL